MIGKAHIKKLTTPSNCWDKVRDFKIAYFSCKLVKDRIKTFLIFENRRGFSFKSIEIPLIDIFALNFISICFCLNADY